MLWRTEGSDVVYCRYSVVSGLKLVYFLPGQTSFEVPEVEIAVNVSKHQGVTFPGDAGNTTHTALQHRTNAHIQ